MPRIVTLTTSFQEREPSAAILKGILLRECPDIQIVDLSHNLPNDDIVEGALFLASAIPCFPEGAIHLVDVAPGPAPMVLATHGQLIVCPDNGIITMLIEPGDEAWAIHLPESCRPQESQIFFGCEVFAPIAARLAQGAAPQDLGLSCSVTTLAIPKPVRLSERKIRGEIIHVNRFGNLITNIHRSFLGSGLVQGILAGSLPLQGISRGYSDVGRGCPLALFGREGFLEVAYNGDRADACLALGKGIYVTVTLAPEALV